MELRLSDKGVFSNAAILLFGKDPQKYFIQAQTKIGRFDNAGNLIATNLVEGNLFKQLQETLDLLRIKYLPGNIKFEGIVRKDNSIIPELVLREALINALIHRMYNTTVQINIKVFDDRLEIQNPGRLPRELTTEDLNTEHLSIPRNKLIADCFYKAGLIEAWGRGTLLMRNLCFESSLPPPEFEQHNHVFKVILRYALKQKENNGGLNGGLKEALVAIINEVKLNPGIKAKQLSAHLSRSISTIEKQIKLLIEKSIIEHRGSKKTGGYFVKES